MSNEFALADMLEEARLRGALRDAPDQGNAMRELGQFLTAHSHDREAARLFRRALQTDAADVDALFLLGELLHSYEENRAEAVALLHQVVALDPERVATYRLLAWSLLKQEKRSEAVAVLRNWVKRAPDDPTATHLLARRSAKSCAGRIRTKDF